MVVGCLFDGYLVDAQLHGSCGNLDFCHVAYFLVEQSLCDGCLDGEFTFAEVGLLLADDGVGHLCSCGEVGHLYLREYLHGVGRESLGVDDFCLGDGEFELVDFIFQMCLSLFGGIIL